jgi:hypothetical protein
MHKRSGKFGIPYCGDIAEEKPIIRVSQNIISRHAFPKSDPGVATVTTDA